MPAHPADIVGFWRNAGPKQWFVKNPAFDSAIRLKFEAVHLAASRRAYDTWIETAEGSLALVILLDQFPRNLWRGSPHAYATDPLARRAARAAIAADHDREVEAALRPFFYLPFEHSETLADQDLSVMLCEGLLADTGETGSLKWAKNHRDIIARFGRFPHRNAFMGRDTTPQEQAFLDEGGFSG